MASTGEGKKPQFNNRLREKFAAKAMQSLIIVNQMFASEVMKPHPNRDQLESIVKASYKIADAMIEEGQNKQGHDSDEA